MKPDPRSDLWERLAEAVDQVSAEPPPRPPEAFTAREYMEKMGLGSLAKAQRELRDLVIAGKVRPVPVPIKTSAGFWTHKPGYQLVK